jgi:hypothetical protein
VDPSASLDDVEKTKFLTLPGLELRPVASRYTDYAIPVPDLSGKTGEYHENLRQDSRCSCGYSNPTLLEYKSETLPLEPDCWESLRSVNI